LICHRGGKGISLNSGFPLLRPFESSPKKSRNNQTMVGDDRLELPTLSV
jgi:hypothetical protein